MSPSPTVRHQRMLANLLIAMSNFVRAKNLGEVIPAPLDVRLTDYDVYQPDLLFIRQERLQLTGADKIGIVPDLVIEILSPSNAYYDFTRKKAMYAEHGVEEYWIVDPLDETIEVMVKEGEYYRTESLYRASDTLESPMLPGFQMQLETVFAF